MSVRGGEAESVPFRERPALRWLPRGQTLPEDIWTARHRAIMWLLWAHVGGIVVYALIRHFTLGHALLEAAIVAVPATLGSARRLKRRTRTIAASVGLLSSSAVLVHLAGGLIEMHFHFFVMVGVVALYQDWIPFLTAIAYVLFHHGLMGTLDPRSVYNHPDAWAHPWTWAGVHAFFILGASSVCLVTWRLNENLVDRQRRAEDRLQQEANVVRALHGVGRTLAAELDLKRVVQAVTDASTELTGAEFGAFFYNVVNQAGESFLLYTLSGVPAEAFANFPLPRNTEIFSPTFNGEGVVRLADVRADPRYGKNAPYHGMPEGHLPVRSYLAVPVVSRTGEVIGGLFFGHSEVARFTEVHERIVLGIAAQASVAIDNARLYESERASRVASESARARLALLSEVSRSLGESLEVDEILTGVARLVAPEVADYCLIDLVEGDVLRRVVVTSAPEFAEFAAEMATHTVALDFETNPIVQAMRTGQTQLIEIVRDGLLDDATPDPAYADRWKAQQPTGGIVCPMTGRHGVLGTLCVGTMAASGRKVGQDDVPLVEELARRASIAVENARLYAHQRTVAETLQHSLLPERLPEVPGLQTAARYIAGGPGVDVGGDWYDVIQLPGGALALAMGDVVGRGERAASLMGQLRNAARAYAMDRRSPAEVAEGLNRLLLDLGRECMATMIYAIVDPDTGTLRFVNAGHPPPLVLGRTGDAQFLETEGGVPLGAVPRARYTETVASLQPGSTLVLYTDGLIEDRETSLDDGFARLRAAACEAPEDIDSLCDFVLERALRDRRNEDDVAILALRIVPIGDRLELRLTRDADILSPLRATLRRWLVAAGASEQETYEIVVAAGEACSNAVQHAVGPAPSYFDVVGVLDGDVTITVRDHGRWRAPRQTGGGRGITIMHKFMDSVNIHRTEEGTEVVLKRRLRSQLPKETVA